MSEALQVGPVARTPGGQPLVLGYREVDSLLRDPRMKAIGASLLSGAGIDDGPLFEWWQQVMFNLNPPEHTQLRKWVSRAFTPRRAAGLRPLMRRRAQERLPDGRELSLDFFSEVADPLPLDIMGDLLGVPEEMRASLFGSVRALSGVFATVISPEQRAALESAVEDALDGVRALLDERRARPEDDLLTDLVRAEAEATGVPAGALPALVLNLLFAGFETSRSLLSIGAWLLAREPSLIGDLRAQPDGMTKAIEEILRLEPPTLGSVRAPEEDLVVAGVTLRKGRPVSLLFPAANRDPGVFEEPDRLDHRRERAPHLSFGAGSHFCLGAGLARAEAAEVLWALIERYDIEIEAAPKWVPFATTRRFERLDLQLSRRE